MGGSNLNKLMVLIALFRASTHGHLQLEASKIEGGWLHEGGALNGPTISAQAPTQALMLAARGVLNRPALLLHPCFVEVSLTVKKSVLC